MMQLFQQNPTEIDRIEVNKELLGKIDTVKGWNLLETSEDVGTTELVMKLLLRGINPRAICQSVGIKLLELYSLFELQVFKDEYARILKQHTHRDISLGDLIETGHHAAISKLVNSIPHIEDPGDLIKAATFLSAERVKHAGVKSAVRPQTVVGADDEDIIDLDIGTFKAPAINTVINDSKQITEIGDRTLETLSFEELENEATIRESNKVRKKVEAAIDISEEFEMLDR